MAVERRRRVSSVTPGGALDAKFLLYLVFIVSWFLHLSSRIRPLGVVRFDLLLILTITVLILLDYKRPDPREQNRIGKWLLILVAFVFVTIPFVEWPGSVLRFGLRDFIKAAVFYFFTVQTVDSVRKLKIMVTVFLAAQSFRVVEPLYMNLTEGYWGSEAFIGGADFMDRLSGSPYDIVNPNGLAHVILTTLPFLHFLAPTSAKNRIAYLLLLPAFVYALLLTGSRSGLIGLFALLLVIFVQSKRKVVMAMLVVIGVMVAVPMMDANQRDRFLSIYRKDTKNSGTASGRLRGTIRQFSTAAQRPIVGHGLGTSKEANFNDREENRVAHILYGEVATELGYGGLVIYLCFLYSILQTFVRNQRTLARGQPDDGYLLALTRGTLAWFFMNILFSFATYGLSIPSWYLFAGLTVVVGRLCRSGAEDMRPGPVVVPAQTARRQPRPVTSS